MLSIKVVNPLIFSNPLAIEASQSTINIDKKNKNNNNNNNKKAITFIYRLPWHFLYYFPPLF
jgi:hypothetical protein